MSIFIQPVSASEAFDLIYADHLAMLSTVEQETMQRAMMNSAQLWVGSQDEKILCVWGLIPPTMLSDRAYLWLRTTEHMNEHVFLFVRHSQRAVAELLKHYPLIVGHCLVDNTKAHRWLRWLGAEFSYPQGKFIPFEIKAKSWPQE